MAEKSFINRIQEEVITPVFADNKMCQTCMFAHGDPPWADTPDKGNCQIYERGSILGDKPNEVAYNGADCEYYERAE
jgi:hypothetical protein